MIRDILPEECWLLILGFLKAIPNSDVLEIEIQKLNKHFRFIE
jgi:hypothetical protein